MDKTESDIARLNRRIASLEFAASQAIQALEHAENMYGRSIRDRMIVYLKEVLRDKKNS